MPGFYTDMPVFETDFGRVGMLICFDVDYPEEWARIGAAGRRTRGFPQHVRRRLAVAGVCLAA